MKHVALEGNAMNIAFRTAPPSAKMDTASRRSLLFSLSCPTNPVPGAILMYLTREASPRAIRRWQLCGWIEQEDGHYVLTEKGTKALQQPDSAPPPESFFAIEFKPSK
jgi:hypothetical protein